MHSSLRFRVQGLPVTEKTYLCKELYVETIIRNPEKLGLFRLQVGFRVSRVGKLEPFRYVYPCQKVTSLACTQGPAS